MMRRIETVVAARQQRRLLDRAVGSDPDVGGLHARAHGDGARIQAVGNAAEAAGHDLEPAVRPDRRIDAQDEGARLQAVAPSTPAWSRAAPLPGRR